MKKFNVELKAEHNVSFSNPEKAQAFFIDGKWKDVFYDFVDLEELAGFIALSYLQHGKSFEGFSDFQRTKSPMIVENKCEEYGIISIEVDMDLEVDYITEQEES